MSNFGYRFHALAVENEKIHPVILTDIQNQNYQIDDEINQQALPTLCDPQCRWQCDDPICPAACHPVCNPPFCEVVCEENICADCDLECDEPECAVRCPKDACERDDCPKCETICAPAKCHTLCVPPEPKCNVICAQTQCKLSCITPQCPKPKCQLICEKVSCSVGQAYWDENSETKCCECTPDNLARAIISANQNRKKHITQQQLEELKKQEIEKQKQILQEYQDRLLKEKEKMKHHRSPEEIRRDEEQIRKQQQEITRLVNTPLEEFEKFGDFNNNYKSSPLFMPSVASTTTFTPAARTFPSSPVSPTAPFFPSVPSSFPLPPSSSSTSSTSAPSPSSQQLPRFSTRSRISRSHSRSPPPSSLPIFTNFFTVTESGHQRNHHLTDTPTLVEILHTLHHRKMNFGDEDMCCPCKNQTNAHRTWRPKALMVPVSNYANPHLIQQQHENDPHKEDAIDEDF